MLPEKAIPLRWKQLQRKWRPVKQVHKSNTPMLASGYWTLAAVAKWPCKHVRLGRCLQEYKSNSCRVIWLVPKDKAAFLVILEILQYNKWKEALCMRTE